MRPILTTAALAALVASAGHAHDHEPDSLPRPFPAASVPGGVAASPDGVPAAPFARDQRSTVADGADVDDRPDAPAVVGDTSGDEEEAHPVPAYEPREEMTLVFIFHIDEGLAEQDVFHEREPGSGEVFRPMAMSERERSHLGALDLVLAGEWTRAANHLARHSMAWPRDLAALQVGHLIDFYRAGSRELRDRIARALPAWSEDMPGFGALMGMHAFGLEETGDHARAEKAGRRAVEIEPGDAWAHHAVTHVMEMQGRAADGLVWMAGREAHWAVKSNFFLVHNWWHRALFHLDLQETDAALALYDGPVRGARSDVALDLVDASALLWRIWAQGVEVGERWAELASAWDAHADGRLYPFNDWHAAMAYLGAGRAGEVDRLLAAHRGAPDSEVAGWARGTGAALIEGFAAFAAGRHERAAEHLLGARAIAGSFGGSHAQRDVIDWTLTEAAIRGRLPGMAEALAAERLALKPHSPLNAALLRRAERIAA